MKALILEGAVAQVVPNGQEFPVAKPLFWVNCPDACKAGWSYVNEILSEPSIHKPTQAELLENYKNAIKTLLESTAHSKQFESSLSIVSYVNSSISLWSAQALAFITWRDTIYEDAITILNNVQNGQEIPSIDDMLLGFPQIIWPSE